VIGNYNAYGGGAERWTDVHARMLIERGHEVHLIARRFRGAPAQANCHVLDVRSRFRPRLRFGRAASDLLRTLRSDVVHDMGDGWHADLFMPHHGTRRGIFKHNTRFLKPSVQRARRVANRCLPRYREFRELERRQYDLGTGMLYLAVSRMIGQHMSEYCHVPESKIRVVYNGVDVERFRPDADPEGRRRMRARLDVAEEEVLFLTVAHNFRLKGLDTVLRSVAALRARGCPVKLVVVGNGAIGQYQTIARNLGCAEAVRFVGDQSSTLPFYGAADVFLLPTFYDPCSLVVLEAMATGLPIVTSRFNGVHELMAAGREGVVLDDPTCVDALADAMHGYLEPEPRAAAGAAARSLAEEHSIEHMLGEHLRIYDEIAATRTAGAATPASMPAIA
jgi:UDP-glucose:(heptosyl)LPS alpha-1,3-glucosyltransferase